MKLSKKDAKEYCDFEDMMPEEESEVAVSVDVNARCANESTQHAKKNTFYSEFGSK